jgi:hypothetical protein
VWLIFTGNQGVFARQTECSLADEGVFHPNHRRVDRTFDNSVFVSKVFHCPVFPPVLQCQQEFIFDLEFGQRLAASLVQLLKGLVKDFQHSVKRLFLYAE